MDPLKLLRGADDDEWMREPCFEVRVISQLDLIRRGRKNALAQEQLPERAVFLRPKRDSFQATAQQVTHGARGSRIDVGFRDEPGSKQHGQGESVPAISLDLSLSDHSQAESVSQRDMETESLQTINEPVPVEGALDDDLQVGHKRDKQSGDASQLISGLELKEDRKIIINNTDERIPCA